MAKPIVNPAIPYVGDIPDGFSLGKMVRIQGVVAPDADRFTINLQKGPNSKPRDDTALHISVRLKQGYIARNSFIGGEWGDEQGQGRLPIGPGQQFEIIVLGDSHDFKIAVNGQHFCEFPYRLPRDSLTHLLIDGDVHITLISWEGNIGTGEVAKSAATVQSVGAPNAPNAPPAGPGGYGPPPQGYGPPPGQGYGPPPQGYGPPPQGGYGPPPPGYGPPPPPGSQEQSGLDHFLSSAQNVLAEAIASGAAEKLMGSIFGGQQPQNQQGYNPQNAQYGIYPQLPPQQQQQQRPLFGGNQGSPQMPQYGGEGSVGGLGSVGSILGSLASSLLRPQSQGEYQGGPGQGQYNQRNRYN